MANQLTTTGDGLALQVTKPARSAGLVEEDVSRMVEVGVDILFSLTTLEMENQSTHLEQLIGQLEDWLIDEAEEFYRSAGRSGAAVANVPGVVIGLGLRAAGAVLFGALTLKNRAASEKQPPRPTGRAEATD